LKTPDHNASWGKPHLPKLLGKRGQIFSTDLIVSSIVFLFILTLSLIYSTEVSNRIYLLEADNARNLAAFSAANSLLLSSGSPANWENMPDLNYVSSIGLAKAGNEIHPAKLRKLMDLNAGNYNGVRELLGLAKYNLRISVLALQSRESLAEFGFQPAGGKSASAANRIAFYNGKEVIMRLEVFEK